MHKLEFTPQYERMEKKCKNNVQFPKDLYDKALENLKSGILVRPEGQGHVFLQGRFYTDNNKNIVLENIG